MNVQKFRYITFFGLTRMSSDWHEYSGMNRNKCDWFGMNFNPKCLPGINKKNTVFNNCAQRLIAMDMTFTNLTKLFILY